MTKIGLKHSQFKVGQDFFTPTGRWQCTDKGRRTIVAIKKDKADASWYLGPPYAVPEVVFDENDLEDCVATLAEAKKAWGAAFGRKKPPKKKSG